MGIIMRSNPYRAPEMDPNIRIRDLLDDDRSKRTETIAAIFFAAALGLWLLYLGSTYGPSSMVQSQEPTISAPSQVN
jgi:hypothetical protein